MWGLILNFMGFGPLVVSEKEFSRVAGAYDLNSLSFLMSQEPVETHRFTTAVTSF